MKLSATKYAELLLSLAEKGRISEEMVGAFLMRLRKDRQEKLLPRIILAAERLHKKAHGIRDVSITLSEKTDLSEVQSSLEEALDAKEVILHEEINPELLGGARIEIDDLVYDLTLRRQMERLKNALLS